MKLPYCKGVGPDWPCVCGFWKYAGIGSYINLHSMQKHACALLRPKDFQPILLCFCMASNYSVSTLDHFSFTEVDVPIKAHTSMSINIDLYIMVTGMGHILL